MSMRIASAGVSVRAVCTLILLLYGISGCTLPKQDVEEHDHAHGTGAEEAGNNHDHGEENESLTLWTDRLELFTEFPLLTVGSPQEFLLHLSFVDTGLPVQDLEVTYRAVPGEGGGAAIEDKAQPLRPGIYTIAPVFPAGGEWTLALTVQTGAEPAVITMPDLDVHGEEEMHSHDHHGDEEPANAISFTKELQWVVPVVTQPVQRGRLVERHKIPATVPETPETTGMAPAPLSGLVIPPESGVFPGVGDSVEAGQALAGITPTTLGGDSLAREAMLQELQVKRADLEIQIAQASGEASRARAMVKQYTTALGRAEGLLAAKAGSQRDVEAQRAALAEANAAQAAAEQTAAQARKALEILSNGRENETEKTVTVSAPISGRITRVFSGPGAHVDAGQPLFEVVNTAYVLIEGRAPELLAPALANPPSARYEVPAFPGELHEIVPPQDARQPWTLPFVDNEARTVPVLFFADNSQGVLRVGMTLNLWVDGQSVDDALQIPLSAVVDENGISTVYVMVDGETFQKRPVRLGLNDGVSVQMLDGLREGERVTTRGAYAVRLAGVSGAGLGSAHVH